jgi:hypothetical protein
MSVKFGFTLRKGWILAVFGNRLLDTTEKKQNKLYNEKLHNFYFSDGIAFE